MAMKREDFIGVQKSRVISPPQVQGMYELMVNRWWAVDSDGNLIFHKRTNAPQCNRDKRLVDKLIAIPGHPGVRSEFVQYSWLSHRCEDYG